jgi:hypothetical protein
LLAQHCRLHPSGSVELDFTFEAEQADDAGGGGGDSNSADSAPAPSAAAAAGASTATTSVFSATVAAAGAGGVVGGGAGDAGADASTVDTSGPNDVFGDEGTAASAGTGADSASASGTGDERATSATDTESEAEPQSYSTSLLRDASVGSSISEDADDPAGSSGVLLGTSVCPLPPGWVMCRTKKGRPFFIDHASQVTTFRDPRQMEQYVVAPTPLAIQLHDCCRTLLLAAPTRLCCANETPAANVKKFDAFGSARASRSSSCKYTFLLARNHCTDHRVY